MYGGTLGFRWGIEGGNAKRLRQIPPCLVENRMLRDDVVGGCGGVGRWRERGSRRVTEERESFERSTIMILIVDSDLL